MSTSFSVFGKKAVADLFDWQHVSIKHFYDVEIIGKDGTSRFCTDRAESFLPFHGIEHVNECKRNRRSQAKLQRKRGCRTTAVVKDVTRSWSALLKSIELGSFQNAYWPHFLHRIVWQCFRF